MDTLLPSEVARLVLGYLEEEKCEYAAKCFLDTSSHLSEYRFFAKMGRKYPTKVNGYTLKEVLDEYSLVHSIVQESLLSMNEQPTVGGSMLDNLRFLVRTCQPVQVNISLHPGQSQNSLSKSDCSDSTPSSTRTRSRKITLSSGHPNDYSECPAQLQTVDSSSMCNAYSIVNPSVDPSVQRLNVDDQVLLVQSDLQQQPHIVVGAETQNSQVRQNVTESGLFDSSESVPSRNQESDSVPQELSCQDIHHEPQNTPQQEVFPEGNLHQEPPHFVPVQHLPEHLVTSKDSQHQLQTSSFNTNTGELSSSSNNFSSQPQEDNISLPLDSERGLRNVTKPEEPVRSYTVTQCYGSNIVILDNDSFSQSSITTSGTLQSSNNQDNNDFKQPNSRSKPVTPNKNAIEPEVVCEKLRQKMLENVDNAIITKLVENINRVWTPAKKTANDELQTIGESAPDLDDATVHSILKETEEDPVFEQFLNEFLSFHESSNDREDVGTKEEKKKKRSTKKKTTSGGRKMITDAPIEVEAGGTLSNQLADSLVGNKSNNSMPMGLTPEKVAIDLNTMTPMTKLLKSITSPTGDLYLDPTQFAGLIDEPESATKMTVQEIPKQSQPVQTDNGMMLQLPQPNGTTMNLPIFVCNSNQQVAQFINEKGVNTICEIQVMPQQAPYIPIVPKLLYGKPIPAVLLQNSDAKPTKRRNRPPSKRCLTRGGRRVAGQSRQACNAPKSTDKKNTVTLYAADSQDGASSTITVDNSKDLPLLVPDTAEQGVKSMSPETNEDINESGSLCEASESKDFSTETECPNSIPETIAENTSKEEENNLPSVNASAIRNTPGLTTGPARFHDKRLSFSTPRRRLSHIRALDFNTPPKENERSFRKANTSPKISSTNALSPHTTGKSSNSCVREGLFKLPGDGSRRTSKVKAHLFKSPDYPMGLSSGYKIPSAAVTSTPSEPKKKVEKSLIQRPSSAWDEVGGVKLILDSDVSPVSRPCKKEAKSWDADLRSLLGSNEEQSSPSGSSKRKRKVNPAPQKKVVKKNKKNLGKEEEAQTELPKEDETLDQSQNASTESECEVAKMIEQNLMDISCNSSHNAIPSVNESSAKLNLSISSKTEIQDIEENIKAYCIEKDPVGEKCDGTAIIDESSTSVAPSKVDFEENSPKSSDDGHLENSDSVRPSMINSSVSNLLHDSLCGEHAGKMTGKQEVATSESGELTSTGGDLTVFATAENGRVAQIAWKESFDFNTPVKEDILVMIPQTPRFLSPNSRATEDTPHTKIIKSLPFPVVPFVENSIATPTVPPTPTICATPTVSPNGPAYFQPIELRPSPLSLEQSIISSPVKYDTLENVLIQECTRIEADGMRESVRISGLEVCCTDEKKEVKEADKTADSSKSSSKDLNVKSGSITAVSKCKPNSEDGPHNNAGCARHFCYQRKGLIIDQLARRHSLNVPLDTVKRTPRRTASSGDESDLCMISSPCQSSAEQKKTSSKSCNIEDQQQVAKQRENDLENVTITQDSCSPSPGEKVKVQEHAVKTCETPSLNSSPKSDSIKSAISLRSSSSMSVLQVANIQGVEIEEALDKLHNKKAVHRKRLEPLSKPSRSPSKMPLSPVILSSSEQTQTAVGKLDNLMNSVRCKANENSLPSPIKTKSPVTQSTPIKTKSLAERKKVSSSKKKSDSSKDIKEIVSEDESTQSSSDSSSSLSDSDSSSSSSSSEEGTPVKENVSPGRLTRSRKAPEMKPLNEEDAPRVETFQNAEALNPDQAENQPHNETNNMNKDVESMTSLLLSEEKTATQAINLELHSLVETNISLSNCGRSINNRAPYNSRKPPIFSELELKLQRVKQQIKTNGSVRKHLKKNQASSGNSNTTTSLAKTVITEVIEEVHGEQITKDVVETKELSIKKRSKSENEKDETDSVQDHSMRRRSVSDSACRLSDEDEEFKLHLSGDEKEDPPSKSPSETYDIVEAQMAYLHASTDLSVESPNITKLAEENSVMNNFKTKSDFNKTVSSVNLQSAKSKCSISSKAADKVLRNVLERGFGCSLLPPPNERIKKIPQTSDKVKVDPKSGGEPPCQVLQEIEDNSPSQVEPPSQSVDNPSNGNWDEQDGDLNDEQMTEEIILNTSSSKSMMLTVIYKGLGSCKPKKDDICVKHQQFDLGEGLFVRLSPTNLFTFKDNVTSHKHSDKDFCEIKSQNSNIVGQKSCKKSKTDEKRRMPEPGDRVDSRIPSSRDKSSDNRGSSFRNTSRLRRNRSPSPKYKRGRVYSLDHNHHRDYYRSQDHGSHSKSYSRSSGGKKSSDSEPKSHEPSNSQRKRTETKEAEEGEILSSDSDIEVKSQRKSSAPKARRTVRRGRQTSGERETRHSQRGMRVSSPPNEHNSRRSTRGKATGYSLSVKPSPDRKRDASKRPTKDEEVSPDQRGAHRPKRIPASDLSRHVLDEDIDDADLDNDLDFPVLGEDETEEQSVKDSEENVGQDDQISYVTRRRAPPRSVNAHKTSPSNLTTPLQKRKRKLSTSPEVFSEDKSQNSLESNTENKEVCTSQRSKKMALHCTASATKISKSNEGENVAGSTDIIKNLDVESFLSKIHG